MTVEIAAHVCDLLPGSSSRRMFGGWGIYLDGRMVAIVYDGRIYARAATAAAQQRHVDSGMGQFRPRPTQNLKSFWEVPPEALDNPEHLRSWVDGRA